MRIQVFLRIDVEGCDGPWEVNGIDDDQGAWSFEAPCVPPIGTVLHLLFKPLHALMQPPNKCPFREIEAHKILTHYRKWEVIEHLPFWEIDRDGRAWTGVICHGHNPEGLPDLKYTDLLNPDIFPDRSTAEKA